MANECVEEGHIGRPVVITMEDGSGYCDLCAQGVYDRAMRRIGIERERLRRLTTVNKTDA
jgi:hypothetical protein